MISRRNFWTSKPRESRTEGKSVVTSCTQLATTLNAARTTGAYERKLTALARAPLLIIDDFGLKPLRPPADEDLHDLIAERYERVSTTVASNLDFGEWDQAFPNNRLLTSVPSIGGAITPTA
jgi:DNA replication protein DnaC